VLNPHTKNVGTLFVLREIQEMLARFLS